MLFLLIQPQMLDFISNKFCQPRHLTEHSIRGEGSINPDIPRGNHGNSHFYPCPWQSFANLLKKKLVTPLFVKPRDDPLLPGCDLSKKCEYHFGAKGHTLEECVQLRYQIQDLIDNNLI